MMEWYGSRNLIVQGTGGENHVVGPGSKGALTESINIMDVAHPVSTGFAVATVPARDNLFADCVIADFKSVQFSGTIAESDHFAHKFVTWGHRCLAVADAVFIAPEQGGARIALYVAGTDACGLYLKQNFTGTWPGNRPFLKPVIVGAMRHHGRHCLWQFVDCSTHRRLF